MASKLTEIFSKTDAKSRILIVFGSVMAVIMLVVLGSRYFGKGAMTNGRASVANAPALQSVPGGELSPEYYRALMQANAQSAQQAQLSGTSAVATLVNAPGSGEPAPSGQSCGIVCPGGDDVADVTDNINTLLKSGKLTQAQATDLLTMAKNNVSVDQYAGYLNNLVKEGKLTPEQARKLLDIYSKQHANADLAESAKSMDSLIKAGRLPLDAANSLLALQKRNATADEYSAELASLTASGKISPEVAQQLLAEYTQKQLKAANARDAEQLMGNLIQAGQLSPEVANALMSLQKQDVTTDQYKAALDKLVAQGKLSPQAAQQLMAQYSQARSQTNGPSAQQLMSSLIQSGQLKPGTADSLLALQQQNVTPAQYKAALDKLVAQGLISPDTAQQLMAQYSQAQNQSGGPSAAQLMDSLIQSGQLKPGTADSLLALQQQNVTPDQYKAALDKLVAQGLISPDTAQQLMAQYSQAQNQSGGPSAAQVMNSLIQSGKLKPETANALLSLQQQNATPEEYKVALDKLVAQGAISPDTAQQLMAQYNRAQASGLSATQLMNSLIQSGKLKPATADALLSLQQQNATPEEYKSALDKLVAQGAISPDTAQQLMAQYSQAQNQSSGPTAEQVMSSMIQSGQLTAETASSLMALQKQNATTDQYKAALDKLVAQGQISPETAQQLMTQYRTAKTKGLSGEQLINSLIKTGQLNPEAANSLMALQKQNATTDQYKATLDSLVAQGKMTPEAAQELLAQYREAKTQGLGVEQLMHSLIQSGQLSPESASTLMALQKQNATPDQYKAALDDLVAQGKISPETAQQLMTQYLEAKTRGLSAEELMNSLIKGGQLPPDVANSLMALQKQNPTTDQYKASLDKLVAQGKISPETAIQLMAQYRHAKTKGLSAEQLMTSLIQSGQLNPDSMNTLMNLQKQGATPDQYKAALDKLVSQGKLSPEAAKQLLEQYSQSGLNGSLRLPPEVANQLLALQAQDVPTSQYRAELDKLVASGKISTETAQQLMSQYDQKKIQQGIAKGTQALNDMVASGQITQVVATDLQKLQAKNVPATEYEAQLNRLVSEGKMSAATAEKLAAAYRAQRIAMGPADLLRQLVLDAEKNAAANLSTAVSDNKLDANSASALLDLQNKSFPVAGYTQAITNLALNKKLSGDLQRPLATDYQTLQALRDEAKVLFGLQANNATLQQYSDELKGAVKRGVFTPKIASRLLEDYRALLTPASSGLSFAVPGGLPSIAQGVQGSKDFARLQQQAATAANIPAAPVGNPFETVGIGAGATNVAPGVAPGLGNFGTTPQEAAQFAQAQAQAEADAENARIQRIQALTTAMSGQAQSLINAWAPPVMQYKAGQETTKKGTTTQTTTNTQTGSGNGINGKNGKNLTAGPPLIKAGTILFAVLTTAVDSDYPDTPVMATIVSGNFKGAKMLGKLALAQNQDKVSLNFNNMNMDSWNTEKSVTAFAIDPDTARTVMASDVNYHYLLRYGTLFASSFLTGYANGITQAGTSTTGIFGTSTSHPALSGGSKIAVALGQVGTAWSNAIASYVNTPYTVKVNAGVGIGILFMTDVTQ